MFCKSTSFQTNFNPTWTILGFKTRNQRKSRKLCYERPFSVHKTNFKLEKSYYVFKIRNQSCLITWQKTPKENNE